MAKPPEMKIYEIEPTERFIRVKDLAKIVGLSISEIYRQQREGTFPHSRRYSQIAQGKFWLLSEVQAWMKMVIDSNDDYIDALGLK